MPYMEVQLYRHGHLSCSRCFVSEGREEAIAVQYMQKYIPTAVITSTNKQNSSTICALYVHYKSFKCKLID